ncbi:hypothetical protein [Streptomyces sp. DSM 40907]|uniref:hypothetical protein n=1 Tax=Streptomyces kutzneri TaxID=3051179 RepID=UPI0028D81F3A|nr:hypothetical protein [Streptomyces sp. DSM 40907]
MLCTTPRTAALATGGVLLGTVVAGSASAVGWGSVTVSYDGKSRATAYGDFRNDRNIRAKNKVMSKDLAADGNTVYTTGNWYFENGAEVHALNTPEHNHTYYVTHYLSHPLEPTAKSVRGGTRACVQLGWPVPDTCSDQALPSFEY